MRTPHDLIERIKCIHFKIYESLSLISEICWYYNLKAAVFEPHLLWMCLDFHVATATWLVQVAMEDERTEFMPVEFPLPRDVPKSLSYIPEFVMSNISTFLLALAMLNEGILEVSIIGIII